MKNIVKFLVLGAMTAGALVGCDDRRNSSVTPSSEATSSSQTTSSETSISSLLPSSDSSSSAPVSSSNVTSSSTAPSSSAPTSSSTPASSSVTPTLTGITLNTENVKKEYEQGEALDLTGLVVTATYSNNTTANVTDYTTNPVTGTVFNEIKEETITVSYSSFSETFKVNVVKAVKKDWTADEAKIMSDNLYGQVLPYTGFEESVVT